MKGDKLPLLLAAYLLVAHGGMWALIGLKLPVAPLPVWFIEGMAGVVWMAVFILHPSSFGGERCHCRRGLTWRLMRCFES